MVPESLRDELQVWELHTKVPSAITLSPESESRHNQLELKAPRTSISIASCHYDGDYYCC